ncbi:hypothetical protein [Simkania sp.]|uniref:hypothetical protein n=1 Tax=Simkania sp. TaxID=34094 RepID=UPI003B521ABA
MTVEGISEGDIAIDFNALEGVEQSEEKKAVEKVDFKISSQLRPKICTAFEQVRQIDSSRIVVILSDGSKWHIEGEQSQKAFEAISQNWKTGDDIRIAHYSKGKNDEFILKNVAEKSAYLTCLSKDCNDLSKAYFLTKVDETGYALRTGDGNIWITGYWGACSSQYWKEGDRVIINRGTHTNRYEDYQMIHPGEMDSVWVTRVFTDEVQ